MSVEQKTMMSPIPPASMSAWRLESGTAGDKFVLACINLFANFADQFAFYEDERGCWWMEPSRYQYFGYFCDFRHQNHFENKSRISMWNIVAVADIHEKETKWIWNKFKSLALFWAAKICDIQDNQDCNCRCWHSWSRDRSDAILFFPNVESLKVVNFKMSFKFPKEVSSKLSALGVKFATQLILESNKE